MKTTQYLSIAEVASIYHVHPETVRRWCRSGAVTRKKMGRKWYIHRDILQPDRLCSYHKLEKHEGGLYLGDVELIPQKGCTACMLAKGGENNE